MILITIGAKVVTYRWVYKRGKKEKNGILYGSLTARNINRGQQHPISIANTIAKMIQSSNPEASVDDNRIEQYINETE